MKSGGAITAWAAALLLLGQEARAFDAHKMKKCADNGFCKRHRAYAASPAASPEARGGGYAADESTLVVDGDGARVIVASHRHGVPLELRLSAQPGALIARLRLRELAPLYPRFEPPTVLIESAAASATTFALASRDAAGATMTLGGAEGGSVRLEFAPLRVRFYAPDGAELATFNARGLLEYEHYRAKPAADEPVAAAAAAAADGAPADAEGEGGAAGEEGTGADEAATDAEPSTPDAEGAGQAAVDAANEGAANDVAHAEEPLTWSESFQSHHDTRPRGPSSIGIDVTLNGFAHVYGLPERATSLNLKDTRGEGGYAEPYRLYNLDVFEYDMDSPFGLYGAVPLVYAHSAARSAGLFWPNPSEMYVDVSRSVAGSAATDTHLHWVAESGSVDLFVLLGPTPRALTRQYASLTGPAYLPPLFSLGYHQCRWNYNDEADIADIDARFEALDFPYDVLWLDIEHTDGKRYFTWDARKFPRPAAMLDGLAGRGHKMVTIIDPHIKVDADYPVYAAAKARDLFVRTHGNETFEGWCWPGTSSYLDFLEPDVRAYWAAQLQLEAYKGSTRDLHVWNDMNEPSVFNGPEVTMQKDCLHGRGTVEHRELHNLYGHLQALATAEGLLQRQATGPTGAARGRHFLLTRSFFAGTQRHAAVWTGDNMAKWEHLAASVPMLCTLGLSGLTFSGADVGGFFFNPDVELLERWYQAAAYQPFFRAHAHIETKRREPWLFGEPHTSRMREAVRERYRLLPYLYTLFAEAALDGTPVMRPLWYEFPTDGGAFAEERAFMLGSALLVRVVAEAGATEAEVYLPGGKETLWYDAHTLAAVGEGGRAVRLPAPAEHIPVLQRGGTVVARKERLRRASAQMRDDPYTLLVAPDAAGAAAGELYVDDGESHGYEDGDFAWRAFALEREGKALRCAPSGARPAGAADAAARARAVGAAVERVVLLGVAKPPARVTITAAADGVARELTYTHDATARVLVLRKPGVPVSEDWLIELW